MIAIQRQVALSAMLLALGSSVARASLQGTLGLPADGRAQLEHDDTSVAPAIEDAFDRIERVRAEMRRIALERDPALVCVPVAPAAQSGARLELEWMTPELAVQTLAIDLPSHADAARAGTEWADVVRDDASAAEHRIGCLHIPALQVVALRLASGASVRARLVTPGAVRELQAGLEPHALLRVAGWVKELESAQAELARAKAPPAVRRAAALQCARADLTLVMELTQSWALGAPAVTADPSAVVGLLTRALGHVQSSFSGFSGPSGPQCPPTESLFFNEIYLDEDGTDFDEFIELNGEPFFPLSSIVVAIVDGNGPSSGVLSSVFDLSGNYVPFTEYFVLGDAAVSPVDLIVGSQDTLLDGTATLYLLQESSPGSAQSLLGQDVRTGSSTTLLPQLGALLDVVGVTDGEAGDVVFDSAPALGPSHTGAPAGIWRCSDYAGGRSSRWLDESAARNLLERRTPGESNVDCEFESGVLTCFGDGLLISCPCGNQSTLGALDGCQNSTALGGRLRATGEPSLSADGLILLGSQMPLTSTALYFQGTTLLNGSAGSPFGDGLRCAGGATLRLDPELNSGGASTYPGAGDPSISVKGFVSAPTTRVYQVWHRDAAAFCTPALFNLTNALHVTWFP